MEPTDEAEEESHEVQLMRQQLEQEAKRHVDTLKCCKLRVKEEEEHHRKQQQKLEAELIQATATEGSVADNKHRLNNG